MKRIFLFLLLGIYLVGCMPSKPEYKQWVKQAEAAWPAEPEEARAWLDSIQYPMLLSDKWLTRYCVLACRLADSITTPLPYEEDLDRALYYLEEHGELIEQARMGFYWGRALQDKGLYRPAMDAFKKAEMRSREAEDWHLTARICRSIGNLYDGQVDYQSSSYWIEKAVQLFRHINDNRQEGLSLYLLGREYAALDSFDLALSCMSRADSIIQLLNDSADMATIYNGIGNVYANQGDLENAKAYFFRSLAYDRKDSVPTCSALGCLYLQQDSLEQAEYYLQKAQGPTFNPDTHEELLYHFAELEWKKGNLEAALEYMKKYIQLWEEYIIWLKDTNLAEAENLFDKRQMVLEIMRLQAKITRHGVIIVVSLMGMTIFAYFMIRYRRRMKQQQKELHLQLQEKEQLEQELALREKEKEHIALRMKEGEQQVQELKTAQQRMKQEQEQLIADMSAKTKQEKEQFERKLAGKDEELNRIANKLEETMRHNQELETDYALVQDELEAGNNRIEELNQQLMADSTICRKVRKLAKLSDKGQTASLSEKDIVELQKIINKVYPKFSVLLEQAGLIPSEYPYCCLAFFELTTSQEATLLNVSINTVHVCHTRIRSKLRFPKTEGPILKYFMDRL